MKKRMVYQSLLAAAILSAGMMLTGCGSQQAGDGQNAEQTEENKDETAAQDADAGQKEDEKEQAKEGGESADATGMDAVLGEWKFAYSLDHSDYDEGESYDYCTVFTDSGAPTVQLKLRKSGDTYVADYHYSMYESDYKYYGNELVVKNEPAYEDCENKDWCLEFTEPFEDENKTTRRVTMIDDETLMISEEYANDPSEEYHYHYLNKNIFYKTDSKRFDDPESIRYFDTVTVSSAEELLNNIQNNRKIVLKKGKYDLTSVPTDKVNNKYVKGEFNSIFSVEGVSNLCVEAEDGAEVEITVTDPYIPVITFSNGTNITIRGLTVGHDVEPGYCAGSVIQMSGINGGKIDKCKLYGCGTYGVDANSCYEMEITDCDIYECSYGLLNLMEVSTLNVKNCTLRDSREFSMISVSSGYDIHFEDCKFENNRASADNSYFVELGEYDDVSFKNCKFTGNEYNVFSNYEVKMENCSVENNIAKYSDIISTQKIGDASDLKALYDQAVSKQEDIDKRFETDETLDQTTMNQLSYESYELWDSLLNRIWTYLSGTMDADSFEALTLNQKEWIKSKEAAQKNAGSDFEGGSMQPMVEYNTGADWTRKRAETLLEKYVKE
ncbi:MAG: right-handed parallel beta-helix repeat-containing protein [Lachnospiraceae bacterium]|nr:right-handed parallel beta-helix repeat-containing protein [Lachnospiraceae bacterium]